MSSHDLFCIRKGSLYAIPTIHYNMEMAAQVRLAFEKIQPDCVAVELAETMELQLLHGASRLPDLSVAVAFSAQDFPIYYLCEPCDACFEGLRSALEAQIPAHCIDLDVDGYPDMKEHVPDPYAVHRLGLRTYYESYQESVEKAGANRTAMDIRREEHMARRLKELTLTYDSVLFVCGMFHLPYILRLLDSSHFPIHQHAQREDVQLCTLTEESCREVMAEPGWMTCCYEELRSGKRDELSSLFLDPEKEMEFPPDRQKLIYRLYKRAVKDYVEDTGNEFHGYHLRSIMKFVRNYALVTDRLMPDLYQILSAAKGCVDHNYAYAVWNIASEYPHLKNVDDLPELDLSAEEVWGEERLIRFHLKEKSRKADLRQRFKKDRKDYQFEPANPYSICSHPPEDLIIENFGEYLKQRGRQILSEESSQTVPFTTSLEEGVDVRETIRNWHEKKLYVKRSGKPPGGVGSIVVIFDADQPGENEVVEERFPWCTTWLGEHEQESDMAFYATPMASDIVGPGISRCRYGGFLMSYPPRRMFDVWQDPDYEECKSKSEVLLMAGIDYAVDPVIVYVAASPPRSLFKSYAKRFGKKLVYLPIGQLSSVLIHRLRTFHVLDGHDRRAIADDYIN